MHTHTQVRSYVETSAETKKPLRLNGYRSSHFIPRCTSGDQLCSVAELSNRCNRATRCCMICSDVGVVTDSADFSDTGEEAMTFSSGCVVTDPADAGAGEHATGDADAGGEAGAGVLVAMRLISHAGGGWAKADSSGVDDDTT